MAALARPSRSLPLRHLWKSWKCNLANAGVTDVVEVIQAHARDVYWEQRNGLLPVNISSARLDNLHHIRDTSVSKAAFQLI